MRIQLIVLPIVLSAFGAGAALAAPTKLTNDQREARTDAIEAQARTCANAVGADAKVPCSTVALLVEDLLLLEGRFDKRPATAQVLAYLHNDAKMGERTAAVGAHLEAIDCANMQAEARGNLKALYVWQESYRAEHDTYEIDQKKLEFTAKPENALRYTYVVKRAAPTAFLAVATGTGAAKGDVWEITEQNDLKNTSNMCAPKAPTTAPKAPTTAPKKP